MDLTNMMINIQSLTDLATTHDIHFIINIRKDKVTIQLNKKVNGSKRMRKYEIPASNIHQLTPQLLNAYIVDINTALF